MNELVKLALQFLLFMAGFFGAVFGLIAGMYVLVDLPSCRANAQAIGWEYKWGFWSGCYVQVDGNWEPWSWQQQKVLKLRTH
jgi:hypothetical protein